MRLPYLVGGDDSLADVAHFAVLVLAAPLWTAEGFFLGRIQAAHENVFGKLAEICGTVKKGAKVLVEGKLDISAYTDQEGQKRKTFRVLADTYRLL